MNLRKEQLILRCDVSQERFEALLTNEAIESRFRKLGEDSRVKEASSELANSSKELNRLTQGYGNEGVKVPSFEEVLKIVKLNCIAFIIGTRADDIIFEGKSVWEVVADNLTAEVFLEELSNATKKTEEMKNVTLCFNGIMGSIKGLIESMEEEA